MNGEESGRPPERVLLDVTAFVDGEGRPPVTRCAGRLMPSDGEAGEARGTRST
ncbi:hypothetical protein ACN6K4_003180 [Streptomyces hayashii]|uniref:hypothetical protein n=1 Tax=Streptomyces hayashii TaxID=2839966 RepID=UPI00403CB2F4